MVRWVWGALFHPRRPLCLCARMSPFRSHQLFRWSHCVVSGFASESSSASLPPYCVSLSPCIFMSLASALSSPTYWTLTQVSGSGSGSGSDNGGVMPEPLAPARFPLPSLKKVSYTILKPPPPPAPPSRGLPRAVSLRQGPPSRRHPLAGLSGRERGEGELRDKVRLRGGGGHFRSGWRGRQEGGDNRQEMIRDEGDEGGGR